MLFIITNSALCNDDFLTRLNNIASAKPDRIILREKALSHRKLCRLAESCLEICARYNVPFSINSDVKSAQKLHTDIHLPYSMFIENSEALGDFNTVGVSVHSINEAITAEKFGASYLIAGHIFATESKNGVPPRGIDFLTGICQSVKIPVLGIGGITQKRIPEVINAGAAGICSMSHFMKCADPAAEVAKFKT